MRVVVVVVCSSEPWNCVFNTQQPLDEFSDMTESFSLRRDILAPFQYLQWI
jgi:hypothetical protein